MPRKTSAASSVSRSVWSASMRPRPDAAENVEFFAGGTISARASMRPRPDAAENVTRPSHAWRVPPPRFNEAAARCRGKLALQRSGLNPDDQRAVLQ